MRRKPHPGVAKTPFFLIRSEVDVATERADAWYLYRVQIQSETAHVDGATTFGSDLAQVPRNMAITSGQVLSYTDKRIFKFYTDNRIVSRYTENSILYRYTKMSIMASKERSS